MASDPNGDARPAAIDPRGPRFAAAITSVLLLLGTFLALLGTATRSASTFAERVADPGFIVLAVVAILFVWGFSSPATSPCSGPSCARAWPRRPTGRIRGRRASPRSSASSS
jgi:hypothetical protein